MKEVFANPKEWMNENGYTSWSFKYVRFADGVVLFCDACDSYIGHKTIAKERPEVPPVFAGKIQVRDNRWCYKEGGSMMLGLPSGDSDEEYIDKALTPFGFVQDDDMRYSY